VTTAFADWSTIRPYLPLLVNAHRSPRARRRPLVSVVIATYNWSSVLRYAVASALAQDYRALEMLVVGDGCTDDSKTVVAGFRDPRVRWIGLPVNSGNQSAPNNAGIAAATGEYVAYLGHDDLWLPNHVSHLVAGLERSGSIASTVCMAIGPPGSNLVRLTGDLPEGRGGDWQPPSSVMHRRDAMGIVGPWRDYRDLEEPPDVHFVRQFERTGLEHVKVSALTVLKFNSAWRPDSYRLLACDEQAAFAARIAREHFLCERLLLDLVQLRRADPPENVVRAREPGPDDDRAGWYVAEWRRIRGLTPAPDDDAAAGHPGEGR
jgi:glycosyltransferase involved in cell wall biosynthesis